MRILIISGSRADFGMLTPVAEALGEKIYKCWNFGFAQAFTDTGYRLDQDHPELVMVLGDRYEILASAIAAHLKRIPITHIAGGDVTEGSYDDAMRDLISRIASIHFTTSPSSTARLISMGCRNVYDVGSTGIDYIMHGDWKRARPIAEPYVVVSYQPETIDDTVNLEAVREAVAGRRAVWISPNPDRGSERISQGVNYSHAEFLNLLHHCEEFIGNSSAMLYEAPFMDIKTRMIGKRQRGRVIPWGDGKASERIVNILKYVTL